MHPPGPGNGKAGCFGEQSGPREKLISDDANKLADSTSQGKFWPANVELLSKRGLAFTRRQASRDVVLKCLCGGRLIVDNELPWHVCLGDWKCRVRSMRFEEVVAALSREVRSL